MVKLHLKRTPEEEAMHQLRKKRRKEQKRTRTESSSMAANREDQSFRDKMADAFADEERLDAVEADMNNFQHVPKRWRTSSGKYYMGGSKYDMEEETEINDDPRFARYDMPRERHPDPPV